MVILARKLSSSVVKKTSLAFYTIGNILFLVKIFHLQVAEKEGFWMICKNKLKRSGKTCGSRF